MTAPAAMPEIERIIRRHLDWPVERDRDGAISAAMHDIVGNVQDLFAPILATALAAERERLAVLAEDVCATPPPAFAGMELEAFHQGADAMNEAIAAAIRAGE